MKNNLKKILQLDFKTLLIATLIIVILLLRMCTPKPPTEPGDIIKVDGEKYEVIKRIRDTQYIPQIKTVYKPGEKIYVETPIYIDVPVDVDTNAIIKDYYSKRVYKDTIKLQDSLGFVSITDTIQENKLKGRLFYSNINKILVKDSIIVKQLPKNQLYFGGVVGADRVGVINFFGPNFIYKTKSDKMYSLGVGLNNNQSITIQGGLYWKIKLKK